ncbi:hypothetical protein F383_23947 [Gossypium arboreum]|uniref:Uncharacterized protein n=1 Tax=Gossypium arboreum TaxID=29729 RepID=A0A0B0P6X5_GOSAR|nr:hypothetical protein F383_23947 [Gossypium arboreum]
MRLYSHLFSSYPITNELCDTLAGITMEAIRACF